MVQPTSEQGSGPWYGYKEAARYTGLSRRYLITLVTNGRIRFKRVGTRVLFTQEWLDELVNSNPRSAGQGASV